MPPVPNKEFAVPASAEALARAETALVAHGIVAQIVDDGLAAKAAVLALVPDGDEVHMGFSVTLDTIGVTAEIEGSGRYDAVRPRIRAMDRATQGREFRTLGARPDYMLGSAHAVTEDGSLLIASMTGSQLGAYVMGASTVILVVGHQKVVPDVEVGLRRIREYAFPLEYARARAAYGIESGINKLLIITKELVRDRIHVVLVRECLGF